jgi:hypothetical protein
VLHDVQIQESAVTGEQIRIGGALHNEGDEGECYIKLTLNTGEVYGSDRFIPHWASFGLSRYMTMPAHNLRVKIEVGEGSYLNPKNVQDTGDFTVTNPEPTEPEPDEPENGVVVTGPLGIWSYSRVGSYLNRFLPNIFRIG